MLPIHQLMDDGGSVTDLSLVLRKMREIRMRYYIMNLWVAIWRLLFLVKETFLVV